MGITSFTQLTAWQKANQLRLEIDAATGTFPKSERYELTDQTRTAAESITSNIAEGFGRRYPKEKSRFYNIAEGSAEELKNQLLYARTKGYLREFERLWGLLEEVCRLLRGLIRKTDEWARTGKPPSRPPGEAGGGTPS